MDGVGAGVGVTVLYPTGVVVGKTYGVGVLIKGINVGVGGIVGVVDGVGVTVLYPIGVSVGVGGTGVEVGVGVGVTVL